MADSHGHDLWEKLRDVPALRFQLIELAQARSANELLVELCFGDIEELSLFVRGPLERRLRKVVGFDGVKYIRRECGRLGI